MSALTQRSVLLREVSATGPELHLDVSALQRNVLLLEVFHTARIPSPLPLHVAKTGRNNLNEEFTLLLPTGIGERF